MFPVFSISNRCQCSHCTLMPTYVERVCCTEINEITAKITDANNPSVTCITQHPGFNAVCLNIWVLQAAYYQYRQEYGQSSSPLSLNEYVLTLCKSMFIDIDLHDIFL